MTLKVRFKSKLKDTGSIKIYVHYNFIRKKILNWNLQPSRYFTCVLSWSKAAWTTFEFDCQAISAFLPPKEEAVLVVICTLPNFFVLRQCLRFFSKFPRFNSKGFVQFDPSGMYSFLLLKCSTNRFQSKPFSLYAFTNISHQLVATQSFYLFTVTAEKIPINIIHHLQQSLTCTNENQLIAFLHYLHKPCSVTFYRL